MYSCGQEHFIQWYFYLSNEGLAKTRTLLHEANRCMHKHNQRGSLQP